MFIIHVGPWKDRGLNRVEILNEITILAVQYHLFFFTDWANSIETKNLFGKSMVVVATLNIISNLLMILIDIFKSIRKEFRKKRYYKRL